MTGFALIRRTHIVSHSQADEQSDSELAHYKTPLSDFQIIISFLSALIQCHIPSTRSRKQSGIRNFHRFFLLLLLLFTYFETQFSLTPIHNQNCRHSFTSQKPRMGRPKPPLPHGEVDLEDSGIEPQPRGWIFLARMIEVRKYQSQSMLACMC